MYKSKITKEEVNQMPVVVFDGKITLVDDLSKILPAIQELRKSEIVGIDTETKPSFTRGQHHKVSLVQISTYDHCFLFRLNRLGLPDFLEEFLQNDVLKVGLSLKDDFAMLRKRNTKDPRSGNWVELQDYVPRFGIEEKSLQKIYALLFGKKISKSQRLSNWEAEVLTEAQQLYAATDAWACVEIYNHLDDLRSTGGYEIVKVVETENN